MRLPSIRHTALLLVAAVALASAAYAVGSTSGDGRATAAGSGSGTGSADAAGPAACGADELADALGVDADKLEAALREFHTQQHAAREGAFASALAEALDLDADEVADALEATRPDGERFHGPREMLRSLADELGVTPAELRKALRSVRDDVARSRADEREQLAAFLGERFDLDQSKVEDALESLPGPGPHGGHGGPRFGPGSGPPGGPPPGF